MSHLWRWQAHALPPLPREGEVNADVLRTGPRLYDLMAAPQMGQALADAPTLMRHANNPSPSSLLQVLLLALRTLGDKTSTARPGIDLATMPDLPGKGADAIKRLLTPEFLDSIKGKPPVYKAWTDGFGHWLHDPVTGTTGSIRGAKDALPSDADALAWQMKAIENWIAKEGKLPTGQMPMPPAPVNPNLLGGQ